MYRAPQVSLTHAQVTKTMSKHNILPGGYFKDCTREVEDASYI